MNNIIKAMKMVVSNYTGFTGRATRSEFWYFILGYLILSIIVNVIGMVLGTNVLSLILSLALFLPSLAVDFRRLHDTGRSAWWILIALIPILGLIALIYFFAQPSQEGDNDHGPQPSF